MAWETIVVINKVDRLARALTGLLTVFDLFVNLDATDEQLDFPIIYASAERYRGSGPRRYGGRRGPLYQRAS